MSDKHFMKEIKGLNFDIGCYPNQDGTFTAQATGPIPKFDGMYSRGIVSIKISSSEELAVNGLIEDMEENLLIGIGGLSAHLDISEYTARRTVTEHLWPVLTSTGDLFDKRGIEKKKDELIEKIGMNIEELGLYLGIQEGSLKKLLESGELIFKEHLNSEGEVRFLEYEVDDYIYQLFPDKIWSTIKSHSQAIAKKLNLEVQNCEIDGCDSVASKKCYECGHKICLGHREWIESDKPINLYPDVLCKDCADKVREGELHYKLVK